MHDLLRQPHRHRFRSLAIVLFVAFLPLPAPAADSPPETEPPSDTALSSDSGGAGDLMIAPTRVVLEGKTRAAEITLHNSGTKETTYRMSLIHLRMDENGQYHALEKAGADSADALLRFSPKQVTLAPGASQTVKVMARKPEGLAEGEYRSHLSFRAVPDPSAGADIEAPKLEEGQIAIRLIPVYGVSIPVIVRHGELEAQAGLSDAKLSGTTLALTLTRNGSRSLYGDVVATHVGAGGRTVVGEARGIAVFPPNRKRQVTLALDAPLQGGSLEIEYLAREDKDKPMAKTTIGL